MLGGAISSPEDQEPVTLDDNQEPVALDDNQEQPISLQQQQQQQHLDSQLDSESPSSNVYESCDSSAPEVLARGLSSMLGSVIRDFDIRADNAIRSQDSLSNAIDRLTGELDQLLEDAPLPFILQHAAKISGVRKRVSSLNSVLKLIQRRIDNIDRMLFAGLSHEQLNPQNGRQHQDTGGGCAGCLIAIIFKGKYRQMNKINVCLTVTSWYIPYFCLKPRDLITRMAKSGLFTIAEQLTSMNARMHV